MTQCKSLRDLVSVIDSISAGVSNELTELKTLGRTMKRRADDILAYFDHARMNNGPTEAVNGRIEYLRGTVWASTTCCATSPEHYWTPMDSEPKCTHIYDEPV